MPHPKPRSLSTQLILSFTALVLLTALAVGLPAIWLIRSQMEAQAWTQVGQGVQATAALHAAQQSELIGLATLTAERPSLAALLGQPQEGALRSYLDTLRSGADLDLVAVCGTDDNLLTAAGGLGDAGSLPVCQTSVGGATVVAVGRAGAPAVWLLAGRRMAAGDGAGAWGALAEYGAVLLQSGDRSAAEEQLRALWRNVRLLSPSACAALTLFEPGVGDALVTYEQDARLAQERAVPLEIVVPSRTILTQQPAVAVDGNVTAAERPAAEALVRHLQSAAGRRAFQSYHWHSAQDGAADLLQPFTA